MSVSAGEQAGIIIGCLVGVVAIAALISVVVKVKVDKASKPEEIVVMDNVLATQASNSQGSTTYDQNEKL